jgi:hypothetical protein
MKDKSALRTLRKFFRDEAYIGLGEVPGHNLGMREQGPETDALIESGHLEKVGETPIYINGPAQGVVVKNALKVIGAVAAGAAITLGAYGATKQIRKRKKGQTSGG